MDRHARDYAPYARLFRSRAVRRLVGVLNAVSRETRVPYLVIGGSAVYLHTRANPVDYPDIDIVLDTTVAGAKRFVAALRRRVRIGVAKLAETATDIFFKLAYAGIDIDLFTEQEDRRNLGLPVVIAGVPVKRIEGLIAEKLSRFSYPDILMLFDLLRKRHDEGMVRAFAIRIGTLGRLTTMKRVLRTRPSVETLRKWAKVMAGGDRYGHIV